MKMKILRLAFGGLCYKILCVYFREILEKMVDQDALETMAHWEVR